ncbi:MAG TPA: tail fiber domain-containing protein, partial [Fibrobacteria bacterium]|nr:tail fiber domain-containing protein [Fibrobacteria bacterium]
NIETLAGGLDKVQALRGVRYEWRADEFPEKGFTHDPQIGFIAQEVEQVLPQVVATDANGYKAVDYSKVVPVLVEAIKAQQGQIRRLQDAVCGERPLLAQCR